jgi:hypothetical protein
VAHNVSSLVGRLRAEMSRDLPDITLEDLAGVMFGDAEYWANNHDGP